MRTPSQLISSPQLPRPAAEGLRARSRQAVSRLLERRFPRLVAHFGALILQTGQESSELNIGIGGLLALLATPGGFVSIMLFEKYSSLLRWLRHRPQIDVYWASLPDKYFFIVFSMVITGVVVALKWEKTLPGRQDYANLAPLPLHMRTVFLANLAAIVLLASVFALDVNAVSSFLFPGVVLSEKGTFPELAKFIGVHAICVLLASAFMFFLCFAIMGALMSILPNRAFRKVSLFVRLLLIVSLIAMLCTSFAVLPAVQSLRTHSDSWVLYMPPVWYLGLYQWMQGRFNPALAGAGKIGLGAAGAVLLLALFFSVLSYRRYFLRVPESSDALQTGRSWNLQWFTPLIDRILLRSPFERSCYHFGIRALLRSETHSILFGAFVGLGLVIASQMGLSATASRNPGDTVPGVDILAAPLAIAYFLIVGLRFVFEVPAGVTSNWIYRLILDSRKRNTAAVARKIMLSFLVPGIIFPVLLGYWWGFGPLVGAVHAIYIFSLSVLLMEIVLLRFRKIPFACTLPLFENHAILLVFVYFIGFFLFTGFAAGMERWMLQRPISLLAVPVFLALAWDALRRIRNDTPEVDRELIYEARAAREVQTLNILPVE